MRPTGPGRIGRAAVGIALATLLPGCRRGEGTLGPPTPGMVIDIDTRLHAPMGPFPATAPVIGFSFVLPDHAGDVTELTLRPTPSGTLPAALAARPLTSVEVLAQPGLYIEVADVLGQTRYLARVTDLRSPILEDFSGTAPHAIVAATPSAAVAARIPFLPVGILSLFRVDPVPGGGPVHIGPNQLYFSLQLISPRRQTYRVVAP